MAITDHNSLPLTRELTRSLEVMLLEKYPTHRFERIAIDRDFQSSGTNLRLLKRAVQQTVIGPHLELRRTIPEDAFRQSGDRVQFVAKVIARMAGEIINSDRTKVGAAWRNDAKNRSREISDDMDGYVNFLEDSLIRAEQEMVELRQAVKSMAFDVEMSRGKATALNVRALHKMAVEQAADFLMDHGVITDSADLVSVCEQMKSLRPEDRFMSQAQTESSNDR